jgi:hypothetical protein
MEVRMVEYCAAVPQTSSAELSGLLRQYYKDSGVRKRMYEFLGGADLKHATALYIAGTDGYSDYHVQSPPTDLIEYLEGALEVDRSLWDTQSLIADIDLEYHNFDYPAAPGLGRVPASLRSRYAQPCAPNGSSVDPDLGCAFSGLGLIMEFVGHRVLEASMDRSTLPVQPAASEVGPGIRGREIVSFDLSEYGDPLHTRHVRLPFSAYLKPKQLEWTLGEAEIGRLLPIFEIPLAGLSPAQAIVAMRDPDAVLEIARRVSVGIPDQSEAMEQLLDNYEHSELAEFHQQFYMQLREETSLPNCSIPIPEASPCAQFLLENPNDWLLKPAALQHTVRVLTAIGWSPSSIAHRVCASYSKDCDWGNTWERLEPCNRAIFYTRLFAGMIAAGLDKLIDFNCVSQQEKGYCMIPECSSNLILYRDMLLERRKHR